MNNNTYGPGDDNYGRDKKIVSNLPTFQNGTIVTLKVSFLGQPVGAKCFVYDTYGAGAISIISESGCDIGGFSIDEQGRFLDYYTDSGYTYNFKNVMKLADDFRSGVFTEFFQLPKYISRREK